MTNILGFSSLGIQNKLIDALLNEWQLNKPFVVGHDFGGTTVLRNHILNERAYEKIIVIDPVALSPWGSPFFKHVRKYEVAFAGVPDYIHEAIVKAYVQTAAFKPIDNETLDEIVRPTMVISGWLSRITALKSAIMLNFVMAIKTLESKIGLES